MKSAIASFLALLAVAATAAAVAAGGGSANGSPYSPGLVEGWDGVRARSGDVRYVTLGTPRSTIVAAIRVRSGRVVRSRILNGYYGVPIVTYDGSTGGLSGDERTLVVSAYGPLPGTAGSTRFAVLDAKTFKKRLLIELPGAWSYDAISPDGSTLYLVQHVSAGPNPRYSVRALDVTTGRLFSRPVVDTKVNEALMRGQPATRATSSDGRWAYTLYARPKDAPFVHALDTVRRLAYCVDLPLRLEQGKQMTLRLTLDQDRLTVRSGRTQLAVLNTRTFVVEQL